VFPNHGTAEHRERFREKLWNKYRNILKYHEKIKATFEICPAIGKTGAIVVRYQLPPCYLDFKFFKIILKIFPQRNVG